MWTVCSLDGQFRNPRCAAAVAMSVLSQLKWPPTGAHFLMRAPPREHPPFDPDESGLWLHPDFRWGLVPDECSALSYFSDAGYELRFTERDDTPDDSDTPCLGWMPEPPPGWFLVMVLDTEDGPGAAFARLKLSSRQLF